MVRDGNRSRGVAGHLHIFTDEIDEFAELVTFPFSWRN
jgi:hypothetical protein